MADYKDEMSILDELIEENEFPIVFIGSGISKRFLRDFPNWHHLLEGFWDKVGLTNFYGHYNNLRDKIKSDNPKYDERELDHYSNIAIGEQLEDVYNKAFNSGEIEIAGFSPKDAYSSKLSPFKVAIAKRFNNYTFRENIQNEYDSFKKMLVKTQIILTTNYDELIENSYNEESDYNIKKYIGQRGFFGETIGYAELYKLHGCTKSPNDIVITGRDYEYFDDNSVLISAKIISMMIHSPIIFLGYSLTDVNVREIIRDVAKSLTSEEMEILERKLILVEWEYGQRKLIEEIVNDKDLGCKLRVIKTDNFQSVFDKIRSVNQGIAPTEVRKYQHVIKKLIIDRGKQGTLDSVLLAPEEIGKLETSMQNRNIAVAIGDQKVIFQMPNIIQYSLDYISDKDDLSNEIRLKFAANQGGKDRFPVHKVLDEDLINNSSLHPTEKEKLIRRAPKYSDFNYHYGKINKSSVFKPINRDVNSIINSDMKSAKIFETLSYYITQLNEDELKVFLVKELEDLETKGEIRMTTELRRLILLYDIIKNKGSNP